MAFSITLLEGTDSPSAIKLYVLDKNITDPNLLKMKISIISTCILLIGLFLISCSPGERKIKPDIFLYLADDLSYHDLGCTGNPYVRTPIVDAFSKTAISLENMYTPTAMCAPSRSSLMTGLYPHKHGCHYNHGKIYDDITTLPVYLGDLGYETVLVGKKHIKPLQAFPYVFLDFHELDSFLNVERSKPICVIYASNEPHGPHVDGDYSKEEVFIPPKWIDTEETREVLTKYYADIELMDNEFGDLLTSLKKHDLYDHSLVIFTSDHGYEYFHKWSCYDAGLKVPFFIKWHDDGLSNTPIQALTSFIDILPTFIEIAGGTPSDHLDGKSIVPLLTGDKNSHHRNIFGTHTNRGIFSGLAYPIRSVRDDRYKYIENLLPDSTFQNILTHGRSYDPADASAAWKSWLRKAEEDSTASRIVELHGSRPPAELYDLQNDPFEVNNLINDPSLAEVKEKLQKTLHQWMEAQGDLGADSEMKIPLK